MLARRPDLVNAAFRAHPAEFSSLLRAAAAAEDSARFEEAIRHPKVPQIGHRAALGNPAGAITIVEYMDFQCPYCRQARATLVDLMQAHAGQIRLIVKHTPLEEHSEAMPTALVFEAIARRDPDAAFRFYDDVFEHQSRLSADGDDFLRLAAARAGVDGAQAMAVSRSPEIRAVIDSDMAEAHSFGLEGTPCFLVNGVPIIGAQPLSTFERVISRTMDSSRSGG
jgi:protein-disulfide isomerase